MANIYTPNAANNPTAYTMPQDGDVKPVASIRVALEGLADKTAHIDKPASGATDRYPLASRSVRRTQLNRWAFNPAQCSNGYLLDGSFNLLDGLIMTTLGANALMPLDLPDLCTLTAIDVVTQGAPGHAALPVTTDRFGIELYRGQAGSGGVGIQIMTIQYDPTVGTGNYQFEHLFTVSTTALSLVNDRRFDRFVVRATNEKGANAIAGLRVVEIAAIYTITSQDPGAA